MSRLSSNLRHLVGNYLLGRVDGGPSSARFWYLPEPPNVCDAASAARYLAAPTPHYLMDYRAKLRYGLVGDDGIIRLNYGGDIGPQINPEAAFQYALGWHDRWLETGEPRAREVFLHYARFFRDYQTPEGNFAYRFDWYASPAPWHSALAQSRGASVLLRAWLLTGDADDLAAARRAIGAFEIPIAAGGFVARHPRAGVEYLEEYPYQPTAVINGFMAALFGPFELGRWTGDERAAALFDRGVSALEAMLPHYTTSWWSLYDLDPDSPLPNVHSPRYHGMVTDYLRVLAALSGSARIAEYRDRWARNDTAANRARAYAVKAYKKLVHR